jgi:hypothetical protein
MTTMKAKTHGKDALIYFGGLDVSGKSNTWSMNMGTSDADGSVFGDEWDSNLQGPPNWSASISGLAEGDGSTKISDKLYAGLSAGDQPLLIYPDGRRGVSAGSQYWYSESFVSSANHKSGRKDAYAFDASFKPGINGKLYNAVVAA